MAQIYQNNFSDTLSATLLTAGTTMTLTGTSLKAVAPGDWLLLTLESADGLNREIVSVTSHAALSQTCSVIRGLEGTSARDWSAGTIVEARITAATLDSMMTKASMATYDPPGSVKTFLGPCPSGWTPIGVDYNAAGCNPCNAIVRLPNMDSSSDVAIPVVGSDGVARVVRWAIGTNLVYIAGETDISWGTGLTLADTYSSPVLVDIGADLVLIYSTSYACLINYVSRTVISATRTAASVVSHALKTAGEVYLLCSTSVKLLTASGVTAKTALPTNPGVEAFGGTTSGGILLVYTGANLYSSVDGAVSWQLRLTHSVGTGLYRDFKKTTSGAVLTHLASGANDVTFIAFTDSTLTATKYSTTMTYIMDGPRAAPWVVYNAVSNTVTALYRRGTGTSTYDACAVLDVARGRVYSTTVSNAAAASVFLLEDGRVVDTTDTTNYTIRELHPGPANAISSHTVAWASTELKANLTHGVEVLPGAMLLFGNSGTMLLLPVDKPDAARKFSSIYPALASLQIGYFQHRKSLGGDAFLLILDTGIILIPQKAVQSCIPYRAKLN